MSDHNDGSSQTVGGRLTPRLGRSCFFPANSVPVTLEGTVRYPHVPALAVDLPERYQKSLVPLDCTLEHTEEAVSDFGIQLKTISEEDGFLEDMQLVWVSPYAAEIRVDEVLSGYYVIPRYSKRFQVHVY